MKANRQGVLPAWTRRAVAMESQADSESAGATDRSAASTAGAPATAAAGSSVSGWELTPRLKRIRAGMTRLGVITSNREHHILIGDGIGGGHRWDSRTPGRSLFPQRWADSEILANIEDVAHRPDDEPDLRQSNGRWRLYGLRDDVSVRVVLFPDGSVCTGHPLKGLGVTKNPR